MQWYDASKYAPNPIGVPENNKYMLCQPFP